MGKFKTLSRMFDLFINHIMIFFIFQTRIAYKKSKKLNVNHTETDQTRISKLLKLIPGNWLKDDKNYRIVGYLF